MAGVAKILGGYVIDKSNEQLNFYDEKYKGKIFGLYFSASWCPPSCRFTSTLVEFYNQYHEEKNFEIIALSSDTDQYDFDDYYEQMPWPTLEFGEEKLIDELKEEFDIEGIPTLILLDGDSGQIICKDAREQLEYKDQEGQHFPWKSKSYFTDCILL